MVFAPSLANHTASRLNVRGSPYGGGLEGLALLRLGLISFRSGCVVPTVSSVSGVVVRAFG